MNLRNHSLGAFCFGLVLSLSFAAPAAAQLSKVDQKCRDAIAKNFGKAVNSAAKVSAGCHKNRDSGKLGQATDCNDLSQAQADSKGKFAKAQGKLTAAVTKSCNDPDGPASFAAVGDFVSCPEPCATSTGVPNPMTTLTQVGDCLACLAGDLVERRMTVMMGSPGDLTADKDAQKCHGAIAKGYNKHLATIIKERQSCQKTEDKEGNNELQPCDTSDLKGKIQGAEDGAEAGLDSSCAGVTLADLDSCSAVDLNALKACLLAEDNARGAEAFKSAYELDATICPTRIDSTVLAGAGTQGNSRSSLEIGWSNLVHDADLPDRYTLSSDVTCAVSPPCGDCSIDGISVNGPQYSDFSRCNNLAIMDQQCTMPFQNDPACGNTLCTYVLGPPLPLSAGGTPTCNINKLANDISGTVNPDTGSGELNVNLKTLVFLGDSLTHPCPVCKDDPIPKDGLKGGHCENKGIPTATPCDVEAFDESFAKIEDNEGLSLDCKPTGTNVSGAGVTINLEFTTGSSSLAFQNACDGGLSGLDCACGVCTLNTALACRNDTECSDASAGTCTTKGGGVDRRPNSCSDLTCTDVGNEQGRCMSGDPSDTLHFCDGALRSNGTGYVQCTENADCGSSDCNDALPGDNDCGNCTVNEVSPCFLDPIEAAGAPDPDNPLLVSTFCIPPTNNAGINGTGGLPGPARVKADMLTEKAF